MAKKRRKLNIIGLLLIVLLVVLCFILIGMFLNKQGIVSLPSSKYEVMLDAGHDLEHPGYETSIKENDYTNAIVSRLYAKLSEHPDIKVSLTHESEEKLSIEKRIERIDRENPDVVISIHAGYDPSTQIHRTRIITQLPTNEEHEKSLAYANLVKDAFTNEVEPIEVGYYYYVPTHNNMESLTFISSEDTEAKEYETMELLREDKTPIILVEGFNINNPEDVAKWTSEEGYEKMVDLYYQAILNMLEDSKQ